VAGPLHPAAVAVIVVIPYHISTNVTSPVDSFIVFPAARLVASIL